MASFEELPDSLLSIGRSWITTDEIAELTGAPKQNVAPALQRLRRKGKIFSPARGFHVVVPPDFRSWGVIPGEQFIDGLMKHLGRSYYVSLLTAAAMHGASHQAPQVFQVMTDRPVDDRDCGPVRLRFHFSQYITADLFEERQVRTGRFRLATREATLVDLVSHPHESGGLSNIATVVREIGDVDTNLVAAAAQVRSRSVARRLGWLLETFREDLDAAPLRSIAAPDRGYPTRLVHQLPGKGLINTRWNLLINSSVEPDL